MTSSITGNVGQRLIASLTAFANLCLEGRVPSVVRPILYGASLCALNKKDGGVRPIAVGSTLRRLVAKAACQFGEGSCSHQAHTSSTWFRYPTGC